VQTQVGIVLGSPRYMSPEQVAGKRAEPRSDNFSLGVIIYEMLTGRPPFNGEDVTSVMFQILNLVPPPPSAVNAEVPEMLDFIIAKALAKAPADRYANASELAADLRECQKRIEAAGVSPAAAPVASKPATTTFNPGPAADLLARTVPAERRKDKEVDPDADTVEQTAPAALGLSKAFDSLDATMRLAVNTGMTTDMKSLSQLSSDKTGGVNASPGYHIIGGLGWTTRDKLIFATSVIGAIVVGAFIVVL
jgi:serine/threonine-protein kinase